jgi:hypothetical protein
MRIGRALLLSFLATPLFGACNSNEAPSIDPITAKYAYVNSAFELTVTGSDPDGDRLTFSYSSDIADLAGREGVSFGQDGSSALFRWTPKSGDIGIHPFTFNVTDGKETRSTGCNIEVLYQPSSTSPIFREPVGTGTIVDVSKTPEIKVHVVVEDSDTPEVSIGQEEPVAPGSEIVQDGPQTAYWTWTPTPAQLAAMDRHVLTLSADDHSNTPVLKNYLIVLKKPMKSNCPGGAPVVQHTPSNETTVVDVTIDAVVQDDKGLAHEPMLYYSMTDPGSVPDPTQMTQVAMIQITGDAMNGQWAADVPNPVATAPAGTAADVYYVIVAKDNDDAAGDCDHETQAPAAASYKMTVTNAGGEGGLGVCEPCSHDTQCGGGNDNCLGLGSSGEGYCGKACTDDAECPPSEYYCSISEWPSKDGAKSRQCIPKSFECKATQQCADDSFEPNDTRDDVLQAAGLQPGTYDAMSCPGATAGSDDDWYIFDIGSDTQVNISIQGSSASDLDLQLVDKDGNTLQTSAKLGSNESVSACVGQGYYFILVNSTDKATNSYKLTFQTAAQSCSSTCTDDAKEPDDSRTQARNVPVDYGSSYKAVANQICSGNDDWYKMSLMKGETVYATIAFTQTEPNQDLDLRFYDATTILTKCEETNTSDCQPANGQSSDSNENLKWTVPATGSYYVVVHGWQGSQNKYDICISVNNQTACPTLP